MKLKTLKDLEVYGSGFAFKKSKKFPYKMYREIDIKQEAIKDIKSFQENPYSLFNKWGKIESKAVIEYIKWKFNITDEDQ